MTSAICARTTPVLVRQIVRRAPTHQSAPSSHDIPRTTLVPVALLDEHSCSSRLRTGCCPYSLESVATMVGSPHSSSSPLPCRLGFGFLFFCVCEAVNDCFLMCSLRIIEGLIILDGSVGERIEGSHPGHLPAHQVPEYQLVHS